MACAVYFPFVWFCVARSKIIQSSSFSASSCRTTVSLGLDSFWPRASVFTVRIFFSYFLSPRFRFLVSCFILPSSFVRCFVHPRSWAGVGSCHLVLSLSAVALILFYRSSSCLRAEWAACGPACFPLSILGRTLLPLVSESAGAWLRVSTIFFNLPRAWASFVLLLSTALSLWFLCHRVKLRLLVLSFLFHWCPAPVLSYCTSSVMWLSLLVSSIPGQVFPPLVKQKPRS
jgi:hypothetical protein